jgi:hypothetical protein
MSAFRARNACSSALKSHESSTHGADELIKEAYQLLAENEGLGRHSSERRNWGSSPLWWDSRVPGGGYHLFVLGGWVAMACCSAREPTVSSSSKMWNSSSVVA